jgi:excisionase family DNA binding protein
MPDARSPVTPVFVSPLEAAHMLGISRTQVYKLLDEGRIESARHGARRLVVLASLHEFAHQLGA